MCHKVNEGMEEEKDMKFITKPLFPILSSPPPTIFLPSSFTSSKTEKEEEKDFPMQTGICILK